MTHRAGNQRTTSTAYLERAPVLARVPARVPDRRAWKPAARLARGVSLVALGAAAAVPVGALPVVSLGALAASPAAAAPTLKGYTPLTPVRICDTRAVGGSVMANQCQGAMGAASPLGPGATKTVAVTGSNGVPPTATAAVLNVTAANTTAASYLTVWPTGATRPTASNLNWTAGKTVPNLVEVGLSADGKVNVYNNLGSADVIVDLEGFVDGAAPGLFNPLAPARICDSRAVQPTVMANQCQGTGGVAGTLPAAAKKVISVAGAGGVPPSGATAVVLNVTVTNTTAAGFLTVWPEGAAAQPLASNLNWTRGQTVPNRVIVPLGTGGKIDVFNSAGMTDVVIDVNGYYAPANVTAGGGGYTALTPARVCDTRPPNSQVAANQCNDPAGRGSNPIGPMGELTLGAGGGVTAVVFNVTVTNTTDNSYLTVFPDQTPGAFTQPPLISDLNWAPGQTVANLVVVAPGSAALQRAITFYNNAGFTDLVVDLEGEYTTTPSAVSAAPLISGSLGPRGA